MTEQTAPLSGRHAIVTGGGSGIGEACARALAAAGARVTVADIDLTAAERVAGDIGGTAWQVDLADTAALAELSLDADILVNNAGIQRVSPIEDFDPEFFARMLRIMLEAPFLLIRASLPHMYAQNFGRIINISSVTACAPRRSSRPTSPPSTASRGSRRSRLSKAPRTASRATASTPGTCARRSSRSRSPTRRACTAFPRPRSSRR